MSGAFGSFGTMFAPLPDERIVEDSSIPPSTLDPAAAQYLAQHVARVKLQAAESAFSWSTLNEQLTRQNTHLQQQVQKLERVVRENSLQWRLRERDDWKNLVSAVQKDRDRLEHENSRHSASIASLRRQLTMNGIEPLEVTTITSSSPAYVSSSSSSTTTTSSSLSSSLSSSSSANATIATSTPTATTTTTTSTSAATAGVSSASAKTTSIPHPDAENIPQATLMRFKELEAQLAESLGREDHLRQRLQRCEGELQTWRVEKQADLLAMIEALQQKLNLELEQKWARNRGFRPLTSPSKSAPTGILSRFVEVLAPYPEVEGDFDETTFVHVARMIHDADEKI